MPPGPACQPIFGEGGPGRTSRRHGRDRIGTGRAGSPGPFFTSGPGSLGARPCPRLPGRHFARLLPGEDWQPMPPPVWKACGKRIGRPCRKPGGRWDTDRFRSACRMEACAAPAPGADCQSPETRRRTRLHDSPAGIRRPPPNHCRSARHGRFSGSPRALAQGSTRLLELQSGAAVGSRQRCPEISGFEFRWEHQSCVGPGAWAAASRRIFSPSRRMRRRIPLWRCPVPARGGWRSGGLHQPVRKGWIPAPARFRRWQAAIVAFGSGQSVLAGAGRLAQAAAAPPGSARVEDVWTCARRCPGGRSRREEAARLAGAPVPAVAPSRCRTAHRPF